MHNKLSIMNVVNYDLTDLMLDNQNIAIVNDYCKGKKW